MHCSDCSKSVKPVVAIDIDGTLGDYHKNLAEFHSLYWAADRNDVRYAFQLYDGRRDMRDWWTDTFERTTADWNDMKLAYRQGGWKRWMPSLCDVKGFTSLIRRLDAEIWLTTTRPYLRLDNVDPDTRWWLDNQGATYDYMLYDDDKYAVLAERVGPARVVAVLDDFPPMYEAAARQFGREASILLHRPHNDYYVNNEVLPHMAGTHEAALREIVDAVTRWNKETA